MDCKMDLQHIKEHWRNWATQHGTGFKATTRGLSAKLLEIDALSRALTEIEKEKGQHLTILEAGCGNGQNCLYLADKHPHASFLGVDYIEEMIQAANLLKRERAMTDERLLFQVGNVLELAFPPATFDVIFTDRCLINLNTDSLQHQAISGLVALLKPQGHLLMIENSKQTYALQNQAREAVGLPKRIPAEFNHFIDEETLFPFIASLNVEIQAIEDFISLHDILLYVVVPMMNGGQIDYQHPLVEAGTQLNRALSQIKPSGTGQFGQNRLYKCRKIN